MTTTSHPGRRDVHPRQLVHNFVDLHDNHPVVESRRLDNGRRVFGIRTGVEIAVAVGLLGANQRHVRHQIREHPRVEFYIGVNGADLELAVFEELRQAYALRTSESKIEFASDAPLEQRQMFRAADARDQEVQVMDLPRIDLDERTRQEVRLLLVVPLKRSTASPGSRSVLKRLDDRARFAADIPSSMARSGPGERPSSPCGATRGRSVRRPKQELP